MENIFDFSYLEDLKFASWIDWVYLSFFSVIGLGFGTSFFINTYTLLWALEGYISWLNFDWVRDFRGTVNQWGDSLLLIDLIAYPVNAVYNVFKAMDTTDTFNPSNEGFMIMFQLILYPILYLTT